MKISEKDNRVEFKPESESDIFELGIIAANIGEYIGELDIPGKSITFEKRRFILYLMNELAL